MRPTLAAPQQQWLPPTIPGQRIVVLAALHVARYQSQLYHAWPKNSSLVEQVLPER